MIIVVQAAISMSTTEMSSVPKLALGANQMRQIAATASDEKAERLETNQIWELCQGGEGACGCAFHLLPEPSVRSFPQSQHC